MFKLTEQQEYWWPVTVSFPKDGSFTKHTFTALFRVIPTTQVADLARDDPRKILADALIGWKDIVDDDHNEIPYSEEVRDQLLDNPFATRALAEALANSVSGRREKNS